MVNTFPTLVRSFKDVRPSKIGNKCCSMQKRWYLTKKELLGINIQQSESQTDSNRKTGFWTFCFWYSNRNRFFVFSVSNLFLFPVWNRFFLFLLHPLKVHGTPLFQRKYKSTGTCTVVHLVHVRTQLIPDEGSCQTRFYFWILQTSF